MRTFAFLAVILLFAAVVPTALAQTVSHNASQVKAGTFGADFGGGNYTFNNSLVVVDKLGVGTTSPAAAFHVSVSGPTDNNNFYYDIYSNSYFPIFSVRRARGTVGIPSAVQANDALAGYGARGYGATGFATSNRGALIIIAAENWNDTAQGTFLRFSTTQNGTITFNEKMRLSDAGNLGIGTTTPSQKLTVVGDINFTGNLIGAIPGALLNMTVLTSGTSFTAQASTKSIIVEAVGGGGGGGGVNANSGALGGGGGSGGYVKKRFASLSDSSDISISATAINSVNWGAGVLADLRDGDVVNHDSHYTAADGVASIGYNFTTAVTLNKIRFYSLAVSERVKNFTIQRYDSGSWTKVPITGVADGATIRNVDEGQAANANGWNTVTFTAVSDTRFRVYFDSSRWDVGDQNAGVPELQMYGSTFPTYTYAIGAGGTGGPAQAGAGGIGGTGGSTNFTVGATTINAGGGAGGYGYSPPFGGAGGTAANGDINAAGNPGENGGPSSYESGAGASSYFGGGAVAVSSLAAGAGNSGGNYGAGGSGAYSNGNAFIGGAGSAGVIIVYEYS